MRQLHHLFSELVCDLQLIQLVSQPIDFMPSFRELRLKHHWSRVLHRVPR